jgi:hypothetical protein
VAVPDRAALVPVVLHRVVLVKGGEAAVVRADPAALREAALPMAAPGDRVEAGVLAKMRHVIAVPAARAVPRMEAVLPTVIVVVPMVLQAAAAQIAARPIVARVDVARMVLPDSVLAVPADSAAGRRLAKSYRPQWPTN